MTVLHAGGKFGGGAYKVSGGLHGVGASVVNALSSHLSAEIHRDGRAHHQEYQRGIATGPLRKGDQTTERGTSITFLPDTDIFGTIEYDFDDLASHFKDTAYLNKGLEIVFESPWHTDQRQGDIERTYFFDSGLTHMVRAENRGRTTINPMPFHCERELDGNTVEIAFQYNDGYSGKRPILRQLHHHPRGRNPPGGIPRRPHPGHESRRRQVRHPQGIRPQP